MPTPAESNLLTVKQASSLLDVSPDTLRRLDKKGQVKPKRGVNGERLYSADDVSLLKQILKKPVGEKAYGIKEAAAVLGVSAQSIRRWERQGKIKTSRTPGGQRFFTLKDIQALQNRPKANYTPEVRAQNKPIEIPQSVSKLPEKPEPTEIPKLTIPAPEEPLKPVVIEIPEPKVEATTPVYERGLVTEEINPPTAYTPQPVYNQTPEAPNGDSVIVPIKRKGPTPYIILAILVLLLGASVVFVGTKTFLNSNASNNIADNFGTANPTIPNPTAAPTPSNPIQQVENQISNIFKAGSILFQNANGQVAEDNSNFFWDATNAFLGIGTNLPDAILTVSGKVGGASILNLNSFGAENLIKATNNSTTVFNVDHAGNVQIAGALSDINDKSLNILNNLAVAGDVSVEGGDITSSNDLRIYSNSSLNLGSFSHPTTINGKTITFQDGHLTRRIV